MGDFRKAWAAACVKAGLYREVSLADGVPLPVFGTREGDIKIEPPPAIVDPDATVRSRFIGHAAIAAALAATGV